jgi:hypothetical protein
MMGWDHSSIIDGDTVALSEPRIVENPVEVSGVVDCVAELSHLVLSLRNDIRCA